jgi:hypothetical protein
VRGGAEDAEERTRLAREFESLLEAHKLLRQPSFAELRTAADAGPVVIVNFSRYRCDAIIVETARNATVVELEKGCYHALATWLARLNAARPGPGMAQIQANRVLAAALEWLWDAVAEPVFAALGQVPERIWWCPVGGLALLPLHAAGYHSARDGRAVLDRSISSYTPSLGALSSVRAQVRSRAGPDRALVVALPETPGGTPLPNVRHEVAELPFAHDLLTGPQATVTAVADLLPAYPRVHFACHGRQSASDPGNSGIVLHDGILTPWTLAGLPLGGGELAYLSACDTATGDTGVADEVIHPAAVLSLTGFRHVVAALGPVHDLHSVTVAREVYSALRDGEVPATAVHRSVSRLREEYPAMPTVWARYIHLGP